MVKFNNGNGAVVCDICGKIIREGFSDNHYDICETCSKVSPVVDNFDKIIDLLVFNNENSFYWIVLIKRRKDNPGMDNSSRICKEYFITSTEQLMRLKPELVKLSQFYNARVMIYVNSRNFKELTIPMIQRLLTCMKSEQYEVVKKIVSTICGVTPEHNIVKRFIVDVDLKSESYLNQVTDVLYMCGPEKFKIEEVLPTINGYHIICTGFNTALFSELCIKYQLGTIDVHKDHATLLYFCPK